MRSEDTSRAGVSIAAAAAALVGAAVAGAAAAQDATEAYSADDVRRLVDELQETRAEVKELRGEVEVLRARDGDTWLTEARASEIRSLVQDVLADADTRSSLMQNNGATAGWDEGFFLSSGDGDFLLEVDGLMQIRYVLNFQDNPADNFRGGFENTRSQLTLRGHIYHPDLTYLLRGDVTRNEPGLVTGLWFLKDAWVRYQLSNEWSLRFGQFKTPFNREELVAPDHLLAVERSVLNENTNLGRTQGVEVMYATDHYRIMGATGDGASDNIGGFAFFEPGGAPINSNALIEDVEWAFHGRAEWKVAGTWEQFSDFTSPRGDSFGLLLGLGGHIQRGEHGASAFSDVQEDWWGVTGDVSAEFGGANLFASAVFERMEGPTLVNSNRDETHIDIYGFVVQGGWYMTDNVEFFARYEWGQLTTNALVTQTVSRPHGFTTIMSGVAFDSLNVVTVGANWYLHDHDAKLTVDVGFSLTELNAPFDSDIAGWRADGDNQTGQIVFRTQYQLRF